MTKEVAHILLGPCPTSLIIKWTVSSTGKVGVKLGQSLIHVLRNCIKKPIQFDQQFYLRLTKMYFLNFLIEFTQQFIVQISS